MANLRPIKMAYVNETAYEAIERAILQGELPPGAPLNDRRLAELLGISRTPVRDALHRLEGSGLIERRGRHGWTVSSLNARDVREVFELRRLLEPLGLRRLAESWEKSAVTELSGFFEGFPDALPKERFPDYLRCDHEFHKRIVACSQNSRAISFHSILEHQIDRIRHYLSYGYEGRVQASLAEHQGICAAIGSHDLANATELLIRHLDTVEETMVSFIQSRRLGELIGEHPAGE